MRDLVEALRQIEKSPLPDDPSACLTEKGSSIEILPGGKVIVDRIERMASQELVFHQGRLDGEPDYYNQELLKDEGFKVTVRPKDEYGTYSGAIIHTSKGKIEFEW